MSRRPGRNRNRNLHRMIVRAPASPPPPPNWPCRAATGLPEAWAYDLDNVHLHNAAAGLSTLRRPHYPPAPIAFQPPHPVTP